MALCSLKFITLSISSLTAGGRYNGLVRLAKRLVCVVLGAQPSNKKKEWINKDYPVVMVRILPNIKEGQNTSVSLVEMSTLIPTKAITLEVYCDFL